MTGGILILRLVAVSAVVLTYILIVFGGYVASSESGMGCGPEWPLCNGEVIPVLENETLIEFAHRFIGLILSVLVVTLFVLIRRDKTNSTKNAGNWLIGLLIIQVLAGAVVVLLDLPTLFITLHLLVAMLFMLVLLWIWRAHSNPLIYARLSHSKKVKIVSQLNVLIILVLLTMGFGAFIKHEYYGLACSWLNCSESFLPITKPEILQTGHRLIAVITAVYAIFLLVSAHINHWGKRMKGRLLLAVVVVVVQLISGILTIITNISIPWAVVHLAIGTALFMIIADTRLSLGLTIDKDTGKTWTDEMGRPIDKI